MASKKAEVTLELTKKEAQVVAAALSYCGGCKEIFTVQDKLEDLRVFAGDVDHNLEFDQLPDCYVRIGARNG